MLERYRKVTQLKVAFSDVDMMRHVNNLAYLRWAETSRTEYMADVLGEDILGERGMILATMQIAYKVALVYRERAAIGCRVTRIGTKSFDIDHEIWSLDRHCLATTIFTTLVAFDYAANSSIAVPPDWKARIAAFEGTAGSGVPAS